MKTSEMKKWQATYINATGRYAVTGSGDMTRAEAQAEADRLNAASAKAKEPAVKANCDSRPTCYYCGLPARSINILDVWACPECGG